RVDEVEAMLLALVEADTIKDEELRFRAEICRVGDSRRTEIEFSLSGDVARIAVIPLLGHWIENIRHHDQSRDLGEGIQQVEARVWDQQHVAFMDRRPAANG